MCRIRRSARVTSWAVPQTGRRRALASLAEVRARLACAARGFRVRRLALTPLVRHLPVATARYQGGGGVNTVFNFFAQDEARGGVARVRRCRPRSRLTTHLFFGASLGAQEESFHLVDNRPPQRKQFGPRRFQPRQFPNRNQGGRDTGRDQGGGAERERLRRERQQSKKQQQWNYFQGNRGFGDRGVRGGGRTLRRAAD